MNDTANSASTASDLEDTVGFNAVLGMKLVEWTAQHAVMELPIQTVHLNRSNALHGGVIATVLAMAMHSPHDYGVAVHHTSITTMRAADDRRVIHSVNDYGHVLGFQTALNPLNLH